MKKEEQVTPPRIRRSFLDAPNRPPTDKFAWHTAYMRDFNKDLIPRAKKTVKQVYQSPYAQNAPKPEMSLLQKQQLQVHLKNEPQYVTTQSKLDQDLICKCEVERVKQLQRECAIPGAAEDSQSCSGFSRKPWPQQYQPRKECELALHDFQYGKQNGEKQPQFPSQDRPKKCWDDYIKWHRQEQEEISGKRRENVLSKSFCPVHGFAGPQLVQKGIKAPPPRIYNLPLPVVPRPPLPGDITQPRMLSLKAKCWKGIPVPFEDPRFEPLLPENIDTAIMNMGGKNPFRYCDRKRMFPERNRCPNLPVTEDDIDSPDLEGSYGSIRETKSFDKRQMHKKFPRKMFRTKIW